MRLTPARLLILLLSVAVMVTTAQTSGELLETATAFSTSASAAESDAYAEAAITGQSVEISSAGDEQTRVLANPDGTTTTELSSVAFRARTESGSWAPIDYTLRLEGGRVVPTSAESDVSFSAGGDADLVRFASDGDHLALDWLRALPTPTLAGPTATYAEVLPGVDLLMTIVPGGYTQLLRVRNAEAAANPVLNELRFPIELSDGIEPVNREAGGFDLVDASADPAFRSAEALMWDSSGREESPANDTTGSTNPSMEEGDQVAGMEVSATVQAIEVVPDAALLEGADTVYPVFIDPHIVAPALVEWTMVKKEQPTSEFYNWSNDTWGNRGEGVGYQNDEPSTKRLIWEYAVPTELVPDGANVVHSYFRATETHSWSCTKAPVYLDRVGLIGSGTNWSNQPAQLNDGNLASTNTQVRPPDGGPDGCLAQVSPVTFTSAALNDEIERALAPLGGNHIALRLSAAESSSLGWKRFHNDAVLSITHNRPPDMPTDLKLEGAGMDKFNKPRTCGDAVEAERDALPKLAGSVTDDDKDAVDALFDIDRWSRANSRWEDRASVWVTDNASGALFGLQLLPWMVDDGSYNVVEGHYKFTMQGRDESYQAKGPVSGPCHFYLDTDDPMLSVETSINDQSGGGWRTLGAAQQEEWLKQGHTLKFKFDPTGSEGPRGGNDVDYYQISSDIDTLPDRVDPSTLGVEYTLQLATAEIPGEHWLEVKAYDEAGRSSLARRILFRVEPAKRLAQYDFEETLNATPDTGAVADPAFAGSESGLAFFQDPNDRSLRFDGTGTAASASPVVRDTDAAFSVGAWVRIESTTLRRVIMSQRNSQGEVFVLALEPRAECGGLCAVFKVRDPATNQFYEVVSTTAVAADRWVVVAASFSDLSSQHRIRVWSGSLASNLAIQERGIPGIRPGESRSGGRTLLGHQESAAGTAYGRWLGQIDDLRFFTGEVADYNVRDLINTDNPANWEN